MRTRGGRREGRREEGEIEIRSGLRGRCWRCDSRPGPGSTTDLARRLVCPVCATSGREIGTRVSGVGVSPDLLGFQGGLPSGPTKVETPRASGPYTAGEEEGKNLGRRLRSLNGVFGTLNRNPLPGLVLGGPQSLGHPTHPGSTDTTQGLGPSLPNLLAGWVPRLSDKVLEGEGKRDVAKRSDSSKHLCDHHRLLFYRRKVPRPDFAMDDCHYRRRRFRKFVGS